ncbi:MAG: bifunctional phosphopantothenoylcysteine decarboxylase/phosphopantothenate--cysteine ligase CoaBC [Bacteroidales bacterium]|nr:bifunctional phosphopantothenoylcysteine decarboxylase/phosphopantothenate--cysteine ligase CoaBC [Bacteroidales bacterium]
MSLQGKHILIGISAGIAAYKIPFLVRLLKKSGAEVQIIMTPSSLGFVTPLTLSTLSQRPVLIEPFNQETGQWNSHVELSLWADAMIIAPATANTMAKMVTGITDNLLLATYLSARSQVFIAPTMDLDMYQHPVTQENIGKLRKMGHILLEPNTGELASGLEGAGRMQEPEEIFQVLNDFFEKKKSLSHLKILISAGPTFEKIDPVRFIGNHSTGKMGISLCKVFANLDAEVQLISGPGVPEINHQRIKQTKVTTADDMLRECEKHFPSSDITIMAAAIADFKPKNISDKKIKKGNNPPVIELIPTPDVLFNLGKQKKEHQLLIGFALETDQEMEHAKQKLERKNLDFIVLNSLRDSGSGFGFDTNQITIIDKNGSTKVFPLKSKDMVANDILDHALEMFQKKLVV